MKTSSLDQKLYNRSMFYVKFLFTLCIVLAIGYFIYYPTMVLIIADKLAGAR